KSDAQDPGDERHRFLRQATRLWRVLPGASALAQQGGQGALDVGGRQPRERDGAELARGETETAPIGRDGNRAAGAARGAAGELVDEVVEENCGRQAFGVADAAALDQLSHAGCVIARGAGGREVLGAGAVAAIGSALAPTCLESRARPGGDFTNAGHEDAPFSCVNGQAVCGCGHDWRRDSYSSNSASRRASARTKAGNTYSVASTPVAAASRLPMRPCR